MMLFYVGEAVVGLSSDSRRDPAATERASGFTFRRSRIAWKMAARLSMLGLAAKAASCSKPIVALTRFDPATVSPGAPGCLKIDKALRTQDRIEDELDHLLPRRKVSWFRGKA